MSRFSKAEAEAAGWVFTHSRGGYEVLESSTQGRTRAIPPTIVAEKRVSRPGVADVTAHEEAETMGKLLERIHAYEQHLAGLPESRANDIDTTGELRVFSPLVGDDAPENVGEVVQSVLVPAEADDLSLKGEVAYLTEAEWSQRDRTDTLIVLNEDGEAEQRVLAGSGDVAAEADRTRLQLKKNIEDRRAAEMAVGETEQVTFDTTDSIDAPGQGAGGTLVVRAGAESLEQVSRDRDKLKKALEDERTDHVERQGFQAIAPEGAEKLAGSDVSIQERSDLSSEIPRPGRVAAILDENERAIEPAPFSMEPASAVEAEARIDAQEEAALRARDRDLETADSEESLNEVREAGIDAADETHARFVDEGGQARDED